MPVQAPAAPQPEPVREERAEPVREERVETVREEHAAPVREERAAPPPRQRSQAPRVDPKELLESAGLVMIETDRSKVQIQAPVAEEPQPAGRPRRERPTAPPSADGDLVQIETRK